MPAQLCPHRPIRSPDVANQLKTIFLRGKNVRATSCIRLHEPRHARRECSLKDLQHELLLTDKKNS